MDGRRLAPAGRVLVVVSGDGKMWALEEAFSCTCLEAKCVPGTAVQPRAHALLILQKIRSHPRLLIS